MKDNTAIIEVLLLNDLLISGSIDEPTYTKALGIITKEHPEVKTYAA